ncbi:MAG: lipocalin family protein [Oscillospiraceae bacterium]|nr:lipocalin family protein [Oscillospiraceae bacterium]
MPIRRIPNASGQKYVFYKKDVPRVYQAYVEAINQRFGKDCSGQPYHTINFGLSFSFKYHMNGGACTVRLIPYKDGTAVNLRYSIAQAMGARYEKHSDDLNDYVSNILGYAPLRVDIPVEEFLRSERRITPNSRPATPPTPAYTAPAYAAPAAPAYTAPAAPAASPAPQAAPVDYAAVEAWPVEDDTERLRAERYARRIARQKQRKREKILKIVAAAIAVAVVILIVSLCFGSCSASSYEEALEDKIEGKWYAETYSLNGVTKSASEMSFDFSGPDYTFYSDGTYKTAIGWDKGTWYVEGKTVILKMEGSSKSTKLTYSDGKLISISDSGLKIIYGK